MQFRTIAVLSTAAAVSAIALGAGGAQAAGALWGSNDIKDGSLLAKDFHPTAHDKLKGDKGDSGARGPQGLRGPAGEKGPQGPKGDSGLLGAFYATAYYNAGDTNAGAIASVACDATETDFTAIAGGVQVLGLDAGANNRNTPVSSSFPGRMDWSTSTPKADRLDGWIVQFGGNAGAASDVAPEKVKIWALCVPGTDIPAQQTYSQVG